MCEILVLKQNNKKLLFDQDAINQALIANNDGAGYAVFQKNKDKTFDLVEVKHFDTSPTQTKLITEKTKKKQLTYTDYEWEFDKEVVVLSTWEGKELRLQLPKDVMVTRKRTMIEQKAALETWLKDTKIKFDFEYSYEDAHMDSILADEIKEIEEIAPTYSSQFTQKYYSKPKEYKIINVTNNNAISKELYERQLSLKKNQLIIMHFRTATIGKGHTNTQPIVGNDLLTIHNGVFSNLGDAKDSDTAEFTTNLETLLGLASLKSKEEEGNFIETFLEFTQGWYSTFIYSLKTKQLYYFRNCASFFSYANNLMYSTKESRFPTSSKDAPEFK